MGGQEVESLGFLGKLGGFLLGVRLALFSPFVNLWLMARYRCMVHPLAKVAGRVKIGRGAMIARSSVLAYRGSIEIGEGAEIFADCRIYGHADVKVGRWVIMARECEIVTTRHLFDDTASTIKQQGQVYEGVTVGDDVWLGVRVTVLPGARIGHGSVIGAGAVVAGEIPPMSVAVGVPARVIRKRGEGRPSPPV